MILVIASILSIGEKSEDVNHPDYVPSLFSFLESAEVAKRKRSLQRYNRSLELQAKRKGASDSDIVEGTVREEQEDSCEDLPQCSSCIKMAHENHDLHRKISEYQAALGKLKHTYEIKCMDLRRLEKAENEVTQLETQNARFAEGCRQLERECTELRNSNSLMHSDYIKLKRMYNSLAQHARNKEQTEKKAQIDLEKKNQCIMKLEEEKKEITSKMSKLTFTEDSFADDDRKTSLYTGLPNFKTLLLVIQTLSLCIISSKVGAPRILTNFQEIVLVLMKLRLGLCELDIAYRFQISQSTVSRIFQKWIPIMAERLSFLIRWPSRDEVRKTLPHVFQRNFSRCIERPSDLKARAQTWSQYKHHNTIKLFISITPQGTISYISQAWGGRVSDKFLTENCGILNKLLPGDQILADRGFNMEESVSLYCAELKIPPFTRGKKQLSRYEVDSTRQLAHVRIHVERVIGQLKKKYQILQTVIPIKLLNNEENCTIDNIVTVCCALCNLCDSVIPFD